VVRKSVVAQEGASALGGLPGRVLVDDRLAWGGVVSLGGLDPVDERSTVPAAMPIYAYQCTQCGKDEEYIQKFSDPPMEKCEHCGGSLRRLVTSAAFHLKGGGWYKDLYASSKPSEGGGDGSAAPATESKTESKSESKPASAPASTPASKPASTGGSK